MFESTLLFAARGVQSSSNSALDVLLDPITLLCVAGAVVLFLLFLSVYTCYKRCPSNRILVVYGSGMRKEQAARCIHGGARFVIPLIQAHDYLYLDPIQIEIPLRGALSMENIRVNVPSVFTVAIGTSEAVMQNAAIRLLGLPIDEIKHQAADIIFGQLRQVIASMRIEDINRDRETFLENVTRSLEPELQKIGLELINVNITDITDESGYIEAIGRKAAAQAVNQARIDVAEQEKLGQIGVASAEREKQIQVANANKEREIGTKEAQRDQAISLADMDRAQKTAEQRAQFERESQIREAEREMRIRLAEANAQAVGGEAEAQAKIAHAEATLKVQQADAFQTGETRKREAEAAVQEAQNRAMAKAALAEAERVEAERRAALEAPAKAEKAKTIVEAEAEAEKRKIEADGEAQATFAKLEAEARGQYEILAKKGDGLQRIIDACGGAQPAFQMMMLEHIEQLAATASNAISNIKFDKVIVWDHAGNGNGTSSTASFLQNLARSLPPMLQVMEDIGGVQMPEYFARLRGENPSATNNGGETPSKETERAQDVPEAVAADTERQVPPKG